MKPEKKKLYKILNRPKNPTVIFFSKKESHILPLGKLFRGLYTCSQKTVACSFVAASQKQDEREEGKIAHGPYNSKAEIHCLW